MLKIGLVGNPNSGKTTLFNVLTGSNQYVGNWPGVTVEKKEGKINKEMTLVDLPGIYSLSPYSMEEIITRDFLLTENVDVIINIVDATNIERNLYLTTQLMEMNIPIVIALNMMDLIERRQDNIDYKRLEIELNCPVVPISALKNNGLKELITKSQETANIKTNYKRLYQNDIIKVIHEIKQITNCSYFEAVKLMERDNIFLKKYASDVINQIELRIASIEKEHNDDIESIITNERYEYVSQIVKNSVVKKRAKYSLSTSDKIDLLITNRWLALPIFALVMFCVYYVSIATVGDLTVGLVEELFGFIASNIEQAMISINAQEWLVSLVIDGIIGGVGAVLSFVPQLMILFLFLSLLEDSGYMARVAFIMDRLFKRFGLSGKSFIPMLIGTGCTVPAIMATRTIEDQYDRKMTIMLSPFIPCGAKLPVFALFVGAFFSPLAATSMYFLGIFVTGIFLKKTKYFKGASSNFIMELPEYRLPSLKNVTRNVWDRGRAFIIKAGTIIFIASAVIWFLSSFSYNFQYLEDPSESILALIGKSLAWIFIPLGYGTWEATVALITGMVAKETIISTFGIVLKIGSDMTESNLQLEAAVRLLFNNDGLAAYSYMAFILLAAPCFAAIATTRKEMGSRKLMWITVLFQLSVAYIVSLLIYQVGSLWINSDLFKTILILLIILMLLLIALRYTIKKRKQTQCVACSLCDKNTNCTDNLK